MLAPSLGSSNHLSLYWL